MMPRLARWVAHHRRWVILAWVALTIFGMFGAGRLGKRWFQSFSIPGYSAYETNQRTLKTFGSGEQPPLVAVFHSAGDVTKSRGIQHAVDRVAAANPLPGSRVSSYFTTRSNAYVSTDRHTTFAEIYPPGEVKFDPTKLIDRSRAALHSSTPPGVTAHLTGHDPLALAEGNGGGNNLALEVTIAGVGALVILLFVFGTLPAVAMPLAIAFSSILTTFGLIWALTYVTDVSIIVQFLVALIGLGVAIDYSLLMIFRFREELKAGRDTEEALVETMTHAGRSVVVSGSTVAVGLVSLLILPLPFIRSIGIGGMLIPIVSVLASITLLPAFLSLLGPKVNRFRVMPKRMHAGEYVEGGAWTRWAELVIRRPVVSAAVGLAIVVALLIPASKLNPSEAQAKDFPGKGDPIQGRALLQSAGFSAGVIKPFVILVEGKAASGALSSVLAQVERAPGITGASAPQAWRRGNSALIEAFPSADGAAKSVRGTISELQHQILPAAQAQVGPGTRVSLGGIAPEERDFVHAVYGNFPFVLGFVVLLTYLLLARAFRSLLLPLKAVILNLISLGAAYGIVVFIFQQGHGAEAIWSVHPTQAIIPWIPLMIFAFLFGLSMDYEVFMLTRMREAYDETGDTNAAITRGLHRTGKLVTSAALILMLAFFALSTGPGLDIKQFGIGLAAGIIFDATVIRALLVPSIMCLLGKWNWWLPPRMAKLLMVRRPAPETAG